MVKKEGVGDGFHPGEAFEVIAILKPILPGLRGGAFVEPESPLLRLLAQGLATRVFDSTGPDTAKRAASGRLAEAPPNLVAIGTSSYQEAATVADALRRDWSVEASFVAPPRYALGRATGAVSGGNSPAHRHWGMVATGVANHSIDASAVTVAVVDTGVDITHPDLSGAIESYQNFTKESDQDTDGHGIHVCGIIAGRGLRPAGMQGVCNAKLKVFKGLSAAYSATAYYRALREATLQASIVNLSLGGPDHDPAEELIIAQALRRKVLVLAAMGNEHDNGNPPYFPAAFSGVVAVGAVQPQLARADFSNTGGHIALVAPGVKIWSTVPTYLSRIFGQSTVYAACDGTSMATPFVTGVAALVYAHSGCPADALSIASRIPVSACPGQTGWTHELGAGLVDWTGGQTLGRPNGTQPAGQP